jgi:hypothetical protein
MGDASSVENYTALTSSTVTWINELPWLLVAAVAVGDRLQPALP